MTNKIYSKNAPKPVGSYPHSRLAGDFLFLSGVGPRDPKSNLIPGVEYDNNMNVIDLFPKKIATFTLPPKLSTACNFFNDAEMNTEKFPAGHELERDEKERAKIDPNKLLEEFEKHTRKEILEKRKEKFLNIGQQRTFTIFSKKRDWIAKDDFFVSAKEILFKHKTKIIIGVFIILAVIVFLT